MEEKNYLGGEECFCGEMEDNDDFEMPAEAGPPEEDE